MSNPSQHTIANCNRAAEQEYRDDPFGKALANLERIDREMAQATADHLAEIAECRKAIEEALS